MGETAHRDLSPAGHGETGHGGSGHSAPFSGRRIVLLGVIGNALGTGLIGVYGFMVSPLIEEFGATPAQLGLGMSIAILSMAAFAPVLGPLFDRGHLRSTMLAGVAIMFSGMLLISRGSTLWQVALGLAVAAAGTSMYGFLPVQVMIVNWFIRRRGTALAIAAAGTSLAGFAVPPVTAWLIEVATWRGALVWLAVGAAAVAAPAIALLAVRRPEDVGQHPDGDAAAASVLADESSSDSIALSQLAGQANFWLIGIGLGLALCVPVGSSVFFVRHLEELGIPRTQSALVMPVMAACSLAGKLTVGFLADRYDRRLLAVAALLSHVLGLSIVATGTTLGTMFAAALPMGLGGGGFMPLPGILQGACFGRLVIGRVSGLHAFLGLPFLLASAPLVGLAASHTGSFVLPFLGLGCIQLLAAGLLACIRIPQTEPGHAGAAAPLSQRSGSPGPPA